MATEATGLVKNPANTIVIGYPTPVGDTDKIIIRLSDWLMLGSALSLSSAMGVIVLKLAGRISFAKPFGASIVSAVVLSLLGVIYKDQTLDAAPILKKLKKIIPSSNTLGEGSFFDYGDQKYYIARTDGDGACALHAVLGSKAGSSYRKADARKCYVDKLNEKLQDEDFKQKWEEWMIYFLQDYLGPDPGRYSKLVFNHELVGPLKGELAQLEERRKSLKEQQEKLFDAALAIEPVNGKLQQLLQQEEERQNLPNGQLQNRLEEKVFAYTKMRESLNELTQLLKNDPIGEDLQKNQNALNGMDEQRTSCYRQYVKKTEILEAYLNGVQKGGYYFATQEIGLMAYMFDLRITVFHQLPSDTVDIALEEGGEKSEPVAVFHEGIHFSRCELLKEIVKQS